jgi:hypothetical protein
MPQKDNDNLNTEYDDAFRTLLTEQHCNQQNYTADA